MSSLRRVVARVVGVWLVCQFVAFAVAPIALAYAPAIAASLPACCRAGSGHECPMHKTAGAASCSMRALCSSADSALVSLFGVTGVLPDRPLTIAPTVRTAASPAAAVMLLTRHDRPVAPPPRA